MYCGTPGVRLQALGSTAYETVNGEAAVIRNQIQPFRRGTAMRILAHLASTRTGVLFGRELVMMQRLGRHDQEKLACAVPEER